MSGESGTHLCTLRISSLEEANKAVGRYDNRGKTPLVLLPTRRMFQLFAAVPEGFYALLYSHARYIKCLDPGYYRLPPWKRISFLVTKQLTVFDTPVKQCPTQDNVSISIDTVLVFRIKPETPDQAGARTFVVQLGAEKLDDFLHAAQAEAVRGLARQTKLIDVYNLSGLKTDNMKNAMNLKTKDFGVEIISVTITDVKIPEDYAKRLENIAWYSTREKDRIVAFNYKTLKQAHEKEISSKEIELRNRQVAAAKAAEIARIEKEREISLIKQTMENTVSLEETKLKNQIAKIDAETAKTVAKFKAQKDAVIKASASKADAEISALRAEQEAFCRKIISDARLKVNMKRAEVLSEEAGAEEKMGKMLKAKRQYEVDLKRLDVLNSLSNNNNLIITGSNGILSKSPGEAIVNVIPGLAYEKMMLESVESIARAIPESAGDPTGQAMLLDSLHGMYSSRKR